MYFGFNMTISNKLQYISRKGWEVEEGINETRRKRVCRRKTPPPHIRHKPTSMFRLRICLLSHTVRIMYSYMTAHLWHHSSYVFSPRVHHTKLFDSFRYTFFKRNCHKESMVSYTIVIWFVTKETIVFIK